MNEQEAAAWEIHQFFRTLGLPYAVIGGMAVQWWGEPRTTQDVDLTIVAPLDQPSSVIIQQVLDRFPARIENALEFARRSRVILITASNGCPVDISMGLSSNASNAPGSVSTRRCATLLADGGVRNPIVPSAFGSLARASQPAGSADDPPVASR